jgi:hypothetical protein
MSTQLQERNKALVLTGREGLIKLIKSLPSTLKYEAGVVVADGDFVIVHGRFSGFGQPKNWIAADVVRIENGVLRSTGTCCRTR